MNHATFFPAPDFDLQPVTFPENRGSEKPKTAAIR